MAQSTPRPVSDSAGAASGGGGNSRTGAGRLDDGDDGGEVVPAEEKKKKKKVFEAFPRPRSRATCMPQYSLLRRPRERLRGARL